MTKLLIEIPIAVVTLTCWGMTFYKARDLARNPRNPSLRALWVALATITLSLTIQPIAPWIDQVAGLVDFGRAASNCLTLVAAAAAQGFLLYMSDQTPRTARRVYTQYGIAAVCVAAIVVLYATDLPPYDVDDPFVQGGDYYRTGIPPGGLGLYTYVYLAYLSWAMAQVTRLSAHYARIATRPLLRGGLRLIITGTSIALIYTSFKLVTSLLGDRDYPGAPAIDRIMVICFTMSILLILIGSTVPSWGPKVGLDRFSETLTARRSLRKLRPLWTLMYSAAPQIALDADDALPTKLRLVRRTVEILDGYNALGPWLSRQAAESARAAATADGLTGRRRDAAAEAAALVAAAAACRAGQPALSDDERYPALAVTSGTADVPEPVAEVGWLLQVAGALDAVRSTKPDPQPTASH